MAATAGGPVPVAPNKLIDDAGWFHERQVMWPGQCMSLKVKEVLHYGQSEFQEILVFDSETYGRVLVLDGVIQLTERDEHAYQEMITHLPMASLRREPKRVLVVGGGDGGVVREVARYPSVEEITQCEIDGDVIDVAKQFLSASTACSFDDPRLTIINADAAEYIKSRPGAFDVIIVDSSDPVGPAETLFTEAFFQSMGTALAPGGVIATQGECLWLHLPLIRDTLSGAQKLFAQADYAYCTIPTYPSGQIGFILCTSDETPGMLRSPSRPMPTEVAAALRYYTPAVHAAAFVVPKFTQKALEGLRSEAGVAVAGPAAAAVTATADGAGSCGAAKAGARTACKPSGCRFGVGLALGVVVGLAVAAAVGYARQ